MKFNVDFREGYEPHKLEGIAINEIADWEMGSCEFIEQEFIRDLRDLNIGEETTYTELGVYIVFEKVA